jgi:predicted nucleic acid-binding protein
MTADATTGRAFVDTNVLLYAYDRSAGAKHEIAQRLIAGLWDSRTGVLSGQVLQEFYVNVTRKLVRPLRPAAARSIITTYAAWPVHLLTPDDIVEASSLGQRHSVSFWDALIVVAASRLQAVRILTEDMQDGRVIAGVRIENPFRAAEEPAGG